MADETLKSYIAGLPAFKGLDDETVQTVAEHAEEMSLKRGTLLFRQETDAEQFYVVLKGQISVEIPAIFGAPITMQVLGPGEVVGWSWIFPPYKWHFDARATEDSTVIEIDGKSLRDRCDEEPQVGYALVKHFATLMMERLNASRRKVMDLYGPEG